MKPDNYFLDCTVCPKSIKESNRWDVKPIMAYNDSNTTGKIVDTREFSQEALNSYLRLYVRDKRLPG